MHTKQCKSEWTIVVSSYLKSKSTNNKTKSTGRRRPQRRQRAPNNTQSGVGAISKIVRTSDNLIQAGRRFISNRYMGKNGMINVAKDLSLLKMVVNAEEKQIYTLATSQTVASSASLVYGIGTVGQGTASNQRVGDSIKITRIDLNLKFNYGTGTPATTSSLNQVFNWYLVRYKKTPSTSGTTAFNISEFLNQDQNSQYTPCSFPNPDTGGNFQLMANGQVEIILPTVPTAAAGLSRVISISHNSNFHQEYSGSANTTITDNMCFLVVTALNNGNTGGFTSVDIQSAMWFVDN